MEESISLSSYIAEWMQTFKAFSVKQSTYDRLVTSAKALQPYFIASMPIEEITSVHIQKYVNELAESGYGLSTIKKQMRIVTAPLKQASALHLIPADPGVGIKLPVRCCIQKAEKIVEAYSLEEQEKLFRVLNLNTRPGYPANASRFALPSFGWQTKNSPLFRTVPRVNPVTESSPSLRRR